MKTTSIENTKLWVAFDPGTTTGVATWINGTFSSAQKSVVELYEYVDAICDQIHHAQIERFTISARTLKTARVDDPLDVIGYLKYASWRCGFPWTFSKPADVMKSFDDKALKRAGFFTAGKPHSNDAARHLFKGLVLAKVIDPRVFLNGE